MSKMNRKTFLKRAALSSVAAATFPAVLGPGPALASGGSGLRTYAFVSFSRAPASGTIAQPQIGMQGEGVFKPDAHYVHGGGTFVFFDNATATPKPLIVAGSWTPTKFLSYDTKGLASYGNIQPAILEMLADLEGIGSGLPLTIICNVGPAGLSTGQPEGWKLSGTPYGTFVPIIQTLAAGGTIPFGITHLSVEGVTVDRGA